MRPILNFVRAVAVFLAFLYLPIAGRADTIVLKNGHRIVGESVTRENGQVICETPAGRVSISESLVARIEKDDLGATQYPQSNPAAAGLSLTPPVNSSGNMDVVARAVVHDGAIDRQALARFDAAAGSGAPKAIARAIAADSAAGQFEFERGDFAAALAHAEGALSHAPEQVALLLNVAYLHLRRGEYSGALDDLERARRGAPDSPDVAKLMGWADYGLNRLAQAVADWKRAQQLRPDPETAGALEKATRDFDVESNFREGESAHFVVRYDGDAAPDLARAILVVLEDDFQDISSDLRFAPSEPIAVILYTGQAFGDITRAPSWVGALNDGRIRIPVQGLAAVTPALASVLKHELTHSFVTDKTQGRCPVWLQEGLAQWMEGKRSGEAAQMLVALYDRHEDPSLGPLEASWMSLHADTAGLAYAWSLAVVEDMENGAGSGGDSVDVDRLLDRVTTEPSAEAALKSALHMDYADLARATADYLRHDYLHQQ